MKTASFSDFRQNMKEYLQSVEDDQDILILTGPKNKGFVVLTLDEYDAMKETVYLMSSPANAARLAASIKEAEEGKFMIKKLDL